MQCTLIFIVAALTAALLVARADAMTVAFPDMSDPAVQYAMRCTTCYAFLNEALGSAPEIVDEHGEAAFGITDMALFIATGSDDALSGLFDESVASAVFNGLCKRVAAHYGLVVHPSAPQVARPLLAKRGDTLPWNPELVEETCREYASTMHPIVYIHALQGRMTTRHFTEVYCELCQQHSEAVPDVWGVDVPARLQGSREQAKLVYASKSKDL